ncbi:MAG: outer membrane protein assembly factor BamA [Alphaproteobacteria bacterium]
MLSIAPVAIAQNFSPKDIPKSPNQQIAPTNSPFNFAPAQPKQEDQDGNTIKTIKVIGAQKVASATVVAYLPFKIGDRWSAAKGNRALRILNNTGLFAIITITENKGVVTVNIMESPIIDQIAFEGNEEIEDKDFLMVLAQYSPIKIRAIYSRSGIKKAVNVIQQVYLQRGYFQANVAPKLIDIGNNRVQLVFEITEGEAPVIGEFEFYGNDSFSDSELRDKILSTIYNPIKFFTITDRYDPNRIQTDKDNLLRFYREKGFADSAILSATTQLNKSRRDFTITYAIKEGPRYRVDKVRLKTKIKRIPIKQLEDLIAITKGDYYNIAMIEKTQRDIVKALNDDYNYPFMQVAVKTLTHPKKKTVDISLDIVRGQRRYINRIVIKGNGRTLDNIIRRRIPLVEGDALDETAIRRGVQLIRNTGYFSRVTPQIAPVAGRADKVDVIIDVEETSTGALNFSAGYATQDGITLGVTFGENNLLGTARVLTFQGQFAIPVTEEQGGNFDQSYSVSYTEPFLADKDLSMTVTIYRSVNDNIASLQTQTRTGGSVGFRFNYNSLLSQYFYYNFYYDTIENESGGINPTSSGINSIFGQQIAYDSRDNPNDPRSGVYATFGNDLSGLGGDTYYLRTSATLAGYIKIPIGFENDPILAMGFDSGYIFPFNNTTLRNVDRFYLGGQNLRGFQDNSAGPIYRLSNIFTNFLGGRQYFIQSSELRLPIDLLSDLGAKFLLFHDVGYLAYPDEKGFFGVYDDAKIRASWGLGGSFVTPIGPIVLSWAFPYSKGPYDIEQNFRFDFKSKF